MTDEKRLEGEKKKALREKKKNRRRIKRNSKRLLYVATHQTRKPSMPVYILQIITAAILDILVRLFQALLILAVIGIVTVIVAFFVAKDKVEPIFVDYVASADEIAEKSTASDFTINEGTVIYDVDGNLLAELYDTSFCTYLPYGDIPANCVNAFVAIEDRTFWENDGVDYKGIARVLYHYVLSRGKEAHGASTITQQLTRTVYLTSDVSIERKIKEILVARKITKKYSKQQIMEYYINSCCFANGIYGIEGASQAYFNKPSNRLTLAEMAYLCAIPNRPSYYDPLVDSTRAIPRQRKILGDMLLCGYITEDEYNEAISENIVIAPDGKVGIVNDYLASYAIDCAVRYLMKADDYNFRYTFDDASDYDLYTTAYNMDYADYKDKLYTGGYSIMTSLDSDVYEMAQKHLDEELAKYDNNVSELTGIYNLQGALTIIDNNSHKVIAVVGGRNQELTYDYYTLNRAFQSYRQPGSSIKPVVVYAPSFMNGYMPTTICHDIDVKEAAKKGADVQSMTGQAMTLRSAVEQSKNGVAWQIFDDITPEVGLSYATAQHFSSICPDDYYNSSALGGLTYGVTTVEMASAYETLSNHGHFVDPTCITAIYDSEGNTVFKDYDSTVVYSAMAADTMVDVCEGVITNGTATSMGWKSATNMPAFGKTGTTNDNKDVWFCGATPYYSIAVWVGYDIPKSMTGVYGASYPALIWKDCMLNLIDGLEMKDFEKAEDEYSEDDILMSQYGSEKYY